MMTQLSIDPCTPLKALVAQKTDAVIYANGSQPTSNLPTSFISIDLNGGIRTRSGKFENAVCTVAVSVYVKLLSTGSVNSVKENIILSSFSEMFSDSVSCVVGDNKFTYELTKNPVVYSGKNIVADYSTRVINVNCFINY